MHRQRLRPNFGNVDAEQRSVARSPVVMGARCRTDRGTRDYVALVNLTPHGCCVYSREPLLRPGQCVTLQPESLQGLRARVQWSDGCLAGLRFDNPLYGPVFEHLARTFARGEPDPRQGPADGAAPVQCGDAERTALLRKIGEAEKKAAAQEEAAIDRYRRPISDGPRPGLQTQRPAGRVLKLYLGS